MASDLKILFLGDIVGRLARKCVSVYLSQNKEKYDFIIANAENASHGFGLTLKNHDELESYGINCLTSGNHIFDKKDIYEYIENSSILIRPLNYPNCPYGVGFREFENDIVVANILGRTFMNNFSCPFETIKNLSEKIDFQNKIVIVDFHAEATAEKVCFAKYASLLGVSAVIGTHTHIQTADEQIIDNKTFYITDAGSCSSLGGVIGMEYEGSINHFLTMLPIRYEILDNSDKVQINGVSLIFDKKTKKPQKIERIFEILEVQNEG